MLEGMSDHDTSLVATAFHALQPCPKFDIISAVLKALAQPSVHVKRGKAIIQILHCIGIPSHVLVAACLRLRLLHLRTNSRAESLWKSVISCTPMHDPVRRALPVVGVWTSRTLNTLKGTPYGYAMEATIETWNSADDAQRESLILYGLDCRKLMDSLPARDIVRLYRRFGFLPSGYVAATFVDLQTRLQVVAELTKDVSAPMFVVVRFLEFHDLIRLSPETALRFARRFHPLTGLSPLPDDIVQAVLTSCPDHISKQMLPLIVTSAPFHKHMKISSDPASSIPEHLSLLVRLTGMFRPGTPILNVILDYLAITIPVRGACSHRRQMARLPLAARFSDTRVMMGMFVLYVNNIPAGAPVMDTDSDGRTSLHALADVIESTGWYPSYHCMLTGLVLSAGPERAADFVAQEDGRSRTFLDIVAGGALDDLVKCIGALSSLDQHWDLFARVALPTSTNRCGQTVLHYPAFYASASGLSRDLILRCPELLGVRDRYGRSVLHVAVASSCYQAVAWYLSARPELLFVVDHADASVLHDVGPSRTPILMVSALMSVPMTAAAAMHLLTVRDRHGRTAVDVALGKGDLGRHHKVVLFDLHHHMALDHADLRFLEMLPTPDGQLHPYSANGLPAAHQAYDIARTRGLGIDALLGYLSRNPSWTVALDASGNTILHAVCSHGSPSDIDAVSRFMAQTAPREFEALLTVANAAGQRVDDLLRRRMRIPASRTFMSLLDDWSTTV